MRHEALVEFILEDILEFHRDLEQLQNMALSSGIRDAGLVESAVNAAFQSCGGIDAYPTIEGKAAKLRYGLTKNHGFVDGNKRVAVHAMLVFLQVNGVTISYKQDDLVQLVVSVAESQEKSKAVQDMILEWINTRMIEDETAI